MTDVDNGDYDPYSELRFGMGWLAPSEEEQKRRDDEAESERILQEQAAAEREFYARQHGQELHTVNEFLAGFAKPDRKPKWQHDSDCGCADCSNAALDRKFNKVTEDPRPKPRPVTDAQIKAKVDELKKTPVSKWDLLGAINPLKKKAAKNSVGVHMLEAVVSEMLPDDR